MRSVFLCVLGCLACSSSPPALPTSPPAITSFLANPGNTVPNGSVALTWQVTGADSLEIDQGVGPVGGNSVRVNPSRATAYTLTARNPAGSSSARTQVLVSTVAAVTAHDVMVAPGATGALRALVVPALGAPSTEVAWSVPPGSAGSVLPVAGGTTTYVAPLAPGTYQLVAASTWDPTKFTTCTVTVPRPDTWVARPPMPTARGELTAAAVDGKLYAIGGHAGGPGLDVVEEFDPATEAWRARSPLPTPLIDAAASALDGRLYVVGGIDWFGAAGSYQDSTAAYDPATDSWSARGSLPTTLAYPGVAAVGGRLFALGGWTGGAVHPGAEAFDPATNRWGTAGDPMPSPRWFLAAAPVGQVIYAVGGNGAPTADLNEAFDTAAGTWSAKASMPLSRSGHGAVAAKGRIYVVAGRGSDNRTMEYDPGTNAWTLRAPIPTGRNAPGTVLLNGLIYVMGGNDPADVPLATVEAYVPPTP